MSINAYLLRESALSALINAFISLAFVYAVFGAADPLPVPGFGNYAFDFLPQSFAVALMSALVPGLLARKALASGRFPATLTPPVRRVVLRALAWAVGALVVGALLISMPLWLSGIEAIGRSWGIAGKLSYGAVLGAVVTHRSLATLVASCPGRAPA